MVLGGGSASLRLFEAFAVLRHSHGHIVLSLQDNQPWAGAATKVRSPARAIKLLRRRRTAFETATEIDDRLPWTQSAAMPDDDLSRLANSRDAYRTLYLVAPLGAAAPQG